jgi:hypothetical protein
MVCGEHDRSSEIPEVFTPFNPAVREDPGEWKNPGGL